MILLFNTSLTMGGLCAIHIYIYICSYMVLRNHLSRMFFPMHTSAQLFYQALAPIPQYASDFSLKKHPFLYWDQTMKNWLVILKKIHSSLCSHFLYREDCHSWQTAHCSSLPPRDITLPHNSEPRVSHFMQYGNLVDYSITVRIRSLSML